jgi:hypothetical protein
VRVRRLPVVDEYVEDGVAAVFVDGKVLVLSELATALLHRIEKGGTDAEILADALVEAFGPPGDGDGLAATLAAVKELAEYGVVEIE